MTVAGGMLFCNPRGTNKKSRFPVVEIIRDKNKISIVANGIFTTLETEACILQNRVLQPWPYQKHDLDS